MNPEELQSQLHQVLEQLQTTHQVLKHRDQQLEQERQRFSLLFANAPVGIVLTGDRAQIVQCNAAYEEITGYTEAELVHMTFSEITHLEDREQQEWLYKELFSGQRDVFALEKRYIHKAGHCVWAEINVSVIRDSGGCVIFGLTMVTDITRRKVGEAEAAHALDIEKSLLKYEREIQIGRQIQADFLPETLPQPPGWEIVARFSPARDVAGDFYDAFELARGRVGLVIADVCDKGVGAALFMALFRSLIRSLSQQNYALGLLDMLRDDQPPTPTKPKGSPESRRRRLPSTGSQALVNAMTLTNDYIAKTHSRSNMFATIFFGILDPATGVMIYINGGHEPLIVLDANGHIKGRLNPTGPAIGMLPGMTFDMEEWQLLPGDILLAYTDGVPDAHNAARELFTEKRLLSLIQQPADSAAMVLERIEHAVREHIGTADQFDDITMLAVRYLP